MLIIKLMKFYVAQRNDHKNGNLAFSIKKTQFAKITLISFTLGWIVAIGVLYTYDKND